MKPEDRSQGENQREGAEDRGELATPEEIRAITADFQAKREQRKQTERQQRAQAQRRAQQAIQWDEVEQDTQSGDQSVS